MTNRMLFTAVFLYSLALVSSLEVPSLQNCTLGDSLMAMVVCTPMINELKADLARLKTRVPTSEDFKLLSPKCEKTTNCLGKLECAEAEQSAVILKEACTGLKILGSGLGPCMKNVYTAAYHQKNECTKTHDFLTNDLSKRRENYLTATGKSCFLELVKSECKPEALQFVTDDYDLIVDHLTVKPENKQCKGYHHEFEALRCATYAADLVKIKELPNIGFNVNDTNIMGFKKTCDNTMDCMRDSCKFPMSQKVSMVESCKKLDTLNTHFFICSIKISKIKDIIPCIPPNKDKSKMCENFEEKKVCLKNLMRKHCGEEAATDVDVHEEEIKRIFGCK